MADGAARLIELHGKAEPKQKAFQHLTSNDPQQFWVAGQWMTERAGGSDVSRTGTVAEIRDDTYHLYGDKWFTSAASAEMAMTLARVRTAKNEEPDQRLSLFYVETRQPDGSLNNIRINRLKDKMGTRALPTAELTLDGTPARLMGQRGEGIKTIATILNITRIYNAICCVSYVQRGLALLDDYAKKREVFGKPLAQQPLYQKVRDDLSVTQTLSFHLVFFLAELLGKVETDKGTPEERKILRLLTPVAKLFTAKQCIWSLSEVMESFGGNGYIEDTRIPTLLRDAQAFSIWEGTTNVLSLDMWRAIQKSDPLPAYQHYLEEMLNQQPQRSSELPEQVIELSQQFCKRVEDLQQQGQARQQASTRTLAFTLARLTGVALVLRQAAKMEGKQRSFYEECAKTGLERIQVPEV
jgi:alkylation response protein AidB-like acyl-CoA dehydrogenase